MFSSSCIELSNSALKKNIRFLKKQLGPDVRFSSVIKGNAYGHGIDFFVPMAEACGIRHFSVANADEALRASEARTRNSDIMVMGYIDGDALDWAIEKGVSFYVFDIVRLEAALKRARRQKKRALLHLELETGFNRTGLEGDDLDNAVALIKDNPEHLHVEGVCTHYAGAESIANFKRIHDQFARFNDLCTSLAAAGIRWDMRHTAASAASLVYPEMRMDMVRIGIAQYGFWPSNETEMHYIMLDNNRLKNRYIDPLRRVLRWSSRVMSVKDVKRGEFVGYGNTYLTTRPLKVAAIPVGYFHSVRRSLSNLGRVLIHGRRAGIVGIVNMNMILANVSEISDVQVGDEVVIIGNQKKAQITVGSFSDMSNLLNYEVLVRLPSEIPRVIVE